MTASKFALERPSGVRHRVLWLAVIAYMITYMDRVCIGHAAPAIREEFGFDVVTMGWIFSAFNWSYALFQIPGGWLGDRFGPRRVLTMIVLWWSAFTALTALAWGKWSMAAFRFFFGLGEAGAFPTATRALSHWLPASERGFAQGITHSGARLGAAMTPPVVVLLMTTLGWRSVFYIFGLMGVIWAVNWYLYYRDRPEKHAAVNAAELTLIQQKEASGVPSSEVARLGIVLLVVVLAIALGLLSVFYILGLLGAAWLVGWYFYFRGRPERRAAVNAAKLAIIHQEESSEVAATRKAGDGVRVPWKKIFGSANMWRICAMYFCYAYSIWMYLTWFPTYLLEARGFTLKEMGLWHMIALGAATVGDTVGGWLSDYLARRTGNLRLARRSVAIAGFALAVACILPATLIDDRYVSMVFTIVALFSLELTVGVSWAVAMDVGPEYAGSVSGVMNMCGNLGGVLASIAVGYMVKFYNWDAPFLVAGGLCFLGALLFLRIDPNERIFGKPAVPSEPITA